MTAYKSTTAYEARAPRYDEFAAVTMGDRKRQRHYLEDLLRKHHPFADHIVLAFIEQRAAAAACQLS